MFSYQILSALVFAGDEGQGRSGRKWQFDGTSKPRKPVEHAEVSARPDHRPHHATSMANGSSSEGLGRRWDSPEVAEEGEDQYAEREETRASGKGIVLNFKDGEKKVKNSTEGDKESEVKPKKIGEVTVIPKSSNVLDSLSQAKWLKEERASLNRKADVSNHTRRRVAWYLLVAILLTNIFFEWQPGMRGRAREQPKALRRHADDKGQESSDHSTQVTDAAKEEKAEPAADVPEPVEKEEPAEDGIEVEKKTAQTAEEKAKQEQIQQRQQELMEHIQKQIQERQKEEQLRQQLLQQQMAAEEAERRAMYEAAQMQQQQQQQLEQYYQQPHDQYQMPYADAYMMSGEQYPAEQVPDGYEVEEDEPPPGVTPENAPIFGTADESADVPLDSCLAAVCQVFVDVCFPV